MKSQLIIQAVLLMFTISAGTRANAAIVYSGDRNIMYDQYSYNGTISLFDDPGNWDDVHLDVHVFEDASFQNHYSFGNMLNVHGNYVEFAVGNYHFDIKRFSSGELIDGSNEWSLNSYKSFSDYNYFFDPLVDYTSENGEFRNAIGYAALRLTDGDDIYYGWMQVSLSNYNNSGITGTLIDWAYENTPGQGIYAGAIPEPSTTALLFGGAAGLLIALRRRGR